MLGDADYGLHASVSLDWTPFERPFVDVALRADTLELDASTAFLDAFDEADFSETAELISRMASNWDGRLTLNVGRALVAGAALDDFQADQFKFRTAVFTTVVSKRWWPEAIWRFPSKSGSSPIWRSRAQPQMKNVRLEHLSDTEQTQLPFSGVLNLAADLRGEGDSPQSDAWQAWRDRPTCCSAMA